MPELPEVETVALELNQKLKNRVIDQVEVFYPKLVGFGPETLSPKRVVQKKTVRDFVFNLTGRKVLGVKRRAKLLMFGLDAEWSLLVHLKMTGQFIFQDERLFQKTQGKYRLLNRANAPLVQLPAKHTHLMFDFSDKTRLFFNDVRKFAYLKLVKNSDLALVRELHEFGPEPLGAEFTLENFSKRLLKKKESPVKLALLDVRVVAGIGNIYSDEILFLAKVLPFKKVKDLNKGEIERVFLNIPLVLKSGIKAKGSSVGDFVRTDGSWGKMGKNHFVYGRKGVACKICENILVSMKFGGRTSSYCVKCQA